MKDILFIMCQVIVTSECLRCKEEDIKNLKHKRLEHDQYTRGRAVGIMVSWT